MLNWLLGRGSVDIEWVGVFEAREYLSSHKLPLRAHEVFALCPAILSRITTDPIGGFYRFNTPRAILTVSSCNDRTSNWMVSASTIEKRFMGVSSKRYNFVLPDVLSLSAFLDEFFDVVDNMEMKSFLKRMLDTYAEDDYISAVESTYQTLTGHRTLHGKLITT